MKLTNRIVERLEAKAYPYRVKDDATGYLIVQVSVRGVKTWTFRHLVDGKRKHLKVGTFPATDLETARKRAIDLQAKLEAGEPLVEPTPEPEPVVQSATLNELLDDYLAASEARGVKSTYYSGKMFDRLIRPAIGEMLASEVTPIDIHGAIRPHVKVAPSYANMTRKYLSAAFNWAMKAEHSLNRDTGVEYGVVSNPVVAVESVEHANRVNEKYPSMDDLAKVWDQILKISGPSIAYAFKLHIAAGGQRVQEVCNARWEDFDFDTMIWTIPKTKMGRPHFVPIGKHMERVLREIKQYTRGRECVFPTNHATYSPIHYQSLSSAQRRMRVENGLGDWAPRNMRAAVKTHLGDAGVDRIYIDYLQNHAVGSVVGTKHYDKSIRMAEKRIAMDKWDDLLSKALQKQVGLTVVSALA
ncbi:MAG: tyrosine-type recombinase/integrase [Sedimenticola sp.]|nr:tyrosine-type recombinase/integrase [Sedimenticola sp.]